MRTAESTIERLVRIEAREAVLQGDLATPFDATGLVIFAHGSGSGRFSPRNRHVAGRLRESGMATLLLDLLTESEERVDAYTAHLRFDIPLLATRLIAATDWAKQQKDIQSLPIGYFGASTGAAAALIAAAERPREVRAVVSRGGRPDLAAGALENVQAPTLLIVGGRDLQVLELNRQAYDRMRAPRKLEIVEGATHLFEEPGALEEVARLAAEWFKQHLKPSA
ncbi:MAG: dienelactone hydrolase family protein [Bryobacteraceae bacterium]|nr:dienelactone hydrolase family protein [Bryobacteraceae bacterium]